MRNERLKQKKIQRNKKKRAIKKKEEIEDWIEDYIIERQKQKKERIKFKKKNYMSKQEADTFTKSIKNKILDYNLLEVFNFKKKKGKFSLKNRDKGEQK